MTEEMTPRARVALNDYLEDVRRSLRGSGLDEAEVESDIRDHVRDATAGLGRPIDADAMARVLIDLGPPRRWVTEDDVDTPEPSVDARGPIPDGRRLLAWTVLLTTVLGLALFPWIGPFGLLVAWLLARVAVAESRESGHHVETTDAPNGKPSSWRWMVYPPLVLVSVSLVVVVALAPLPPLMEVPLPASRDLIVGVGMFLWWALLTVLVRTFPRAAGWILFPLLSRQDTR
jgi:hypothetical protein